MRRALAALLLVSLSLLSGCAGVRGTGDKGYISGNGQITLVDRGQRTDPVQMSGTTLDGEPISLADYRGRVVVVNLWWSQCPPCRAETADLIGAAHDLGDQASFLGIDVRDASPDLGRSFVRRYGIPYPSVFDPDGEAVLAFHGAVGLRTIPTTVVLDRQGRVAATILGPIPSRRTLVDLVGDLARESDG